MLLCCHWQEFSKGQTSGTASWMRSPSLRAVYAGWLSLEVGIISLGQESALSVGYNAFYGSLPYFRKVQNFGQGGMPVRSFFKTLYPRMLLSVSAH